MTLCDPYRKRAEECRKLAAKLATQSEHWEAFLEMAQTWEMLADLHVLSRRLRSSGALLTPPSKQPAPIGYVDRASDP